MLGRLFGGKQTKSEKKIPTGRKIETYHRYLLSDVAQGKSGGLIIRFGLVSVEGLEKFLWGEVAKWSNAFG